MSELLSVKKVKKVFPMGKATVPVLSDVNLDIQTGDMISIVGASGAGKSTLLHILGALDRPTSGEVSFEGQPLFDKSEKELSEFRNKKVGFVFQFHHLLPEFSALENVMMPSLIGGCSKSEAMEQASKKLGEMGLSARVDHKPSELSGGEQQRVAIARALILKPAILLADELTGNLDRKTGESIQQVLKELNDKHQMTMVIVTHNEELAQKCAKRFNLVDGKILQIA